LTVKHFITDAVTQKGVIA